jgi:transglutaminase-like putative cysteine protease
VRFSAIHKVASYLMALCAFGGLVLSGELGSLATISTGVGIGISWYWEPPRIKLERWNFVWNAAAVSVSAYTVLAGFLGDGWIISGARFLLFLLVAKLFNRRSSRDYQQAYVVSFLMLVAGTTLNADLSYAVCFLGYVVFATWALILFHLRREIEENFLLKHASDSSSEKVEVERILNSKRIVGPAFLAGTSAISLVIFFASALLFFLFPRIGFGLFFQKSRSGVNIAGFSDGVKLGAHGLIRNDPTVVMRVKIDDDRYQGALAPELHFRGVAFDTYARGQWSRSETAWSTKYEVRSTERKTTFYLRSGDPNESKPQLVARAQRGLVQEIYLEPLETSVLFGASQPISFELDHYQVGTRRGSLGQNDEVRISHSSGLRYVVSSDVSAPPEAALRGARPANPHRMRMYLSVPAEIPPRVIELAQTITKEARTPYEKALAVMKYLRTHFTYTLQMDTDDDREPLDYFLFERKMGHCEYFSTAMSILLRAVGVPTRNVNGFLGGEWNEYGDYLAVRSGDAHSWVEVWLDEAGWVTFDPTPPALTPLGRGGGTLLDRMRRMLDTMRLQWFKWFIEYDLGKQLKVLRGLSSLFGLDDKKPGGARMSPSAWLKQHYRAVLVGVGTLVLLILGIGYLRRGPREKTPDRRRPAQLHHPVVVLFSRTAALLQKRGYPRGPARTPREHAASLVTAHAPGASPFAALTELYYDARFGQTTPLAPPDVLSRAHTLATEVREALRAQRASR